MSITFLLLLFAVIAFSAAAFLALPRLAGQYYWAVMASVGLLLWALASLLQTSPR